MRREGNGSPCVTPPPPVWSAGEKCSNGAAGRYLEARDSARRPPETIACADTLRAKKNVSEGGWMGETNNTRTSVSGLLRRLLSNSRPSGNACFSLTREQETKPRYLLDESDHQQRWCLRCIINTSVTHHTPSQQLDDIHHREISVNAHPPLQPSNDTPDGYRLQLLRHVSHVGDFVHQQQHFVPVQ